MSGNRHDSAHGQELDCPLERDGAQSVADPSVDREPASIPRPLAAIHQHCLWCCNGSAQERRLCPAKSCALWGFRLGHKPTEEMLKELGDHPMYPLEDGMTAAEFHKNGGTALQAIKRYVLDYFGGSKSEVRNCNLVTWCLYPFRFGKNPNRKMSPEQRIISEARLKANVERSRRGHK